MERGLLLAARSLGVRVSGHEMQAGADEIAQMLPIDALFDDAIDEIRRGAAALALLEILDDLASVHRDLSLTECLSFPEQAEVDAPELGFDRPLPE